MSIHDSVPGGAPWQGVSPGYRGYRLVWWGIGTLVLLLLSLIPAALSWSGVWLSAAPWWALCAPPVAILALRTLTLVILLRFVARLGYRRNRQDLQVRKGVMFRSLVTVPYGRLQYVDVSSGPVMRLFGISEVDFRTASAGADVTLPGLSTADAETMRESLTASGQEQMIEL